MLRRKNPLDKITRRNYTGDVDERFWLVAETNHGTNRELSKSPRHTKLESNRNYQMKKPKTPVEIVELIGLLSQAIDTLRNHDADEDADYLNNEMEKVIKKIKSK